ncbi:putative acyl-CoA dehydrogenase [Anoxybacillus sp. BCO1]|nr:putative acyl-CoA dehydrogenase [Anoxybacillus sp. BCO1]
MKKQKESIDSMNSDYYLNVIKDFIELNRVKERIAESPDEKFPIDLREKAGQESLIGLDAPKELGGKGIDALTMGRIYKEIGKVDVNTRELFGLGHARMLVYDDNINDYKRDVLSKVIRGESLIGIGITEEGSGSDIKNMQTTVKKITSQTYLLNGKKAYVSRILESEYFLVLAKMVDLNNKLTFFLVPTRHANVKFSNITPVVEGMVVWLYIF